MLHLRCLTVSEYASEQCWFCSNPENELFSKLNFFIYGANLSKVMLVESFLILTISRLFLISTSLIKKHVLFAKSIFFSSGKLDRSKYPQKLMLKYVNSKAEICEN